MGRDKLPLRIGDATLLDRVHQVLASCCRELFVVGAREHILAGVCHVSDLRPDEGPLAGIEAGLLAARYRPVFVAAGDLPFLTSDFVEYILGLLSDHRSAVVPHFGGSHPLCAAYGREVQPVVSAALDRGARSVRGLLETLPRVRYVGEGELWRFGDPNLLLMNVNSPEDLRRARSTLHKDATRGG